MTSTKSILFHYPVFNVGGAEKSSLRMIKAFVARGWRVTFVLTVPGGNMEHLLPPEVEVLHLRSKAVGQRFFAAKGLNRIKVLSDLVCYLGQRFVQFFRERRLKNRQFNVAAALLTGMSTAFIRKHIHADKKVLWIRNDLKGMDKTGQIAASISTGDPEIDLYICVSETARESLVQAVPSTERKAHVVYNLLDSEEMLSLAYASTAPSAMNVNKTKILTVCRLSDKSKAIFRLARICKELKNKGYDFIWFVVGDGPDKEKLSSLITELELSSHLISLGRLENPFPAYKVADIVAVVSYYEGLCGIINEAKIMKKAVLAAEVSGVHEQLVHEETGLICENSESDILAGLERLLTDNALRTKLAESGYTKKITDDELKLHRLEMLFETKSS